MHDPLPSPILPLEVAVVDNDLLWRTEVMNACRPLYADDFEVVGAALDRIGTEVPCVLVVGPASAHVQLAYVNAAREGRPFLRVVVVEPEDGNGSPLSPAPGTVDALVPQRSGTPHIVGEVQRLLTEARDQLDLALTAKGVARDTRLVVVTAAKAGEGATATAVHLSLSLQAQGKQVTLVETDPTFGDIAMRLSLQPAEHNRDDTPLTLSASTIRLLVHPGPLGMHVFLPPHARHELHALPASTMPLLLDTLAPDADVLVVDARLALVLQADLVGLSDDVFLVTTPGLTDLKNAAIAAALVDRAEHVGAVVNRHGAGEKRLLRSSQEPDSDAIHQAIGLPVVAVLPQTAEVARLPDERGDRDFAAAIDKLAARVIARI